MKSFVSLLLFCQICQVFAVESPSCVVQDGGVRRAEVGDAVSLNCSCRDATVTFLFWYKQSPGGKPRIISTWMRHSPKAEVRPTFQGRFQVAPQIQDGVNNLMITNLKPTDSGTYYCGILEFGTTEFGQGVYLHVRNNNTSPGARRPVLKSVGLGESVNLSCTVFAEPCAGEQRLCWFRDGTSRREVWCSSDRLCMRSTDEDPLRTHCTSNLELKTVTSSDVGTYYCALTSCGSTVSGDRTVVWIVEPSRGPSVLASCLAVSVVGILALCFLVCRLQLKLRSLRKGSASHLTCSVAANPTSEDVDDLHYAALNLKRSDKRQGQADKLVSVCVYSSVKSKKK